MASDLMLTQDEDYIVCDECGKPCIFGDCPDHGPLEWIDDSQAQPKTPARASLPSNLYLVPSHVGQDQMGVFSRTRIGKRVMFGPFKGKKIPAKEMKLGDDQSFMQMWDVLADGKVLHIVDGTDEQHSNWMRFVNCARNNKEQNLVAMQFHGEIYYKTCAFVEAGSELLVWYQENCEKTTDSSTRKRQDGHDVVCDICGLMFAGSTFLLRHKSVRCPGVSRSSHTADDSQTLDKGTSTDGDNPISSEVDREAESPYVVVHIGPTNENGTVVETQENSPYVVVHLQPAAIPNEGQNVRRGKRTLVDSKNVSPGKKSKPGNSRSTDSLRKAQKEKSKARVTTTQASLSKVTKAGNNAAKERSLTSEKRKTGLAKINCSPSKSGQEKVKKINDGRAEKNRKKSRSAKKEATGDGGVEKQSAKKKMPKVRDKAKAQKNKSNLSPSRKRLSLDAEETEGEIAKKRVSKKAPRKVKKTKITKSEDKPSESPGNNSTVVKGKATNGSPQEKPVITCEICSRNFKWKSQLRYHMRKHTPEKEFRCEFCNKGLSQLSSLKRHLRAHSGEKPYQCQECGKRFVEKGKLVLHQLKHAGVEPERKYKCTVCERAFTLSANLRTHMRVHTGEKPYPCPQCGKAFKRSSDVASHLRSHTGERPYKCSKCPKAFTMISHRNRHEVIHTGERPFKCNLCGKGFTQPNSVKAHLKVHAKRQEQLEGAKEDAGKQQKQKAPRDVSIQTDGQGEGNEIAEGSTQSSSLEQSPFAIAQRNGAISVGSAEVAHTETPEIGKTVVVEAENVEQGNLYAKESAASGIPHGDTAPPPQLTTPGVIGHLQLDEAVHGMTAHHVALEEGTELTTIPPEQLELTCTNEQFYIVTAKLHGKELLPKAHSEHPQLEVVQNNVQQHAFAQEERAFLAL